MKKIFMLTLEKTVCHVSGVSKEGSYRREKICPSSFVLRTTHRVLSPAKQKFKFSLFTSIVGSWGSGKCFRRSKHPTWKCFGARFWCQSSSLNDIHFKLPISLLQANFHVS